MKAYSEDFKEIAKMIVRKNTGEDKEVKNIYIKDGRVNVEIED